MSPPEFRAPHCTRYRYRYSECRRCADACPHNAIGLSDEGVTIGTDCRHCALCAAACPTEALTAANAAPIELLRRAIQRGSVRIACAPSGQKGDEILPCLGALGAATLGLLASRGVPVVLAGAGTCASCPHGSTGASALALNLDAARILRDTIGNGGWADATLADDSDDSARVTGHDDKRRQLFRRFLSPGEATPLASAQPVPLKAVRFARPVSTAGRELLQILFEQRKAATPDPERPALSTVAHHGALFAAQIEMLPGCTACEVCARACPTAAMEVSEHSAAWELTFRQSRCVGCGLCLEACQPGVLRYSENLGDDPTETSARVLHARSKQRCSLCDRFFVSAVPAETCPVCEGDNSDFAALFG